MSYSSLDNVEYHLTHLLSDIQHLYQLRLFNYYHMNPAPEKWHISDKAAFDAYKPRILKDLHLMYVIQGSGIYELADKKIAFKPGQLFFVTNGYPHRAIADGGIYTEFISFRFGVYKPHGHAVANYFPDPFALCLHLMAPEQQKIETILMDLKGHYNRPQPHSLHAQNILLGHLLLAINDHFAIPRTAQSINPILHHIDQHHGKDVTARSIMNTFHLSKKKLYSLFKNNLNITPQQYVIRIRINYAKQLLEESDMSNQEIAEVIGYKDPFIFSKQFKKLVGLSPKAYRQSTNHHRISR